MSSLIFPGQGSQRKGMGRKLFEKYKDLTAEADSILGYSLEELCCEDPENKLGYTEYTQPALYAVNAMLYLNMIEEKKIAPDYAAGHSLGEYNALFAAGAFDFSTGLTLVRKRGELMGRARGGGMAAVIGLRDTEVEKIIAENDLPSVNVANYNSLTQIVIAGLQEEIEKAQSIFEKAGAHMYIPLRVSGAFHSRFMDAASAEYAHFIQQFNLSEPSIPVISNVTARPYRRGDMKALLVSQMIFPVQWSETIRHLMSSGETDFIEVGYGNVLTKLIRHIQKESAPAAVPGEGIVQRFDETETKNRLFIKSAKLSEIFP